MNFLASGVIPLDSTLAVIATLLAVFGAVALLKSNTRNISQQRLVPVPFDFPFPTGTVSQISQANNNPAFAQLFAKQGKRALAVQPTGSVMSMATTFPRSYAGPVVVQGSKYLWESRWSHLPSFEQGREGEERVVNSLVNTLDKDWYIFRNFVLPTEDEDIDVVLVGPAGVFAMEVKACSGEVQFEKSRCYVRTAHGRLYRQRRGTNGQVRHSAIKLNGFLKEHGIDTQHFVKPMVVMAGELSVEAASTRADVCTVTNLRPRLGKLTSRPAFTPGQVRRIAGVLQTATKEQMLSGLSRVH